MTALELQSKKVELARQILESNDINLLRAVEHLLGQIAHKKAISTEKLIPYTIEEINDWLDKSEADDEAGRTISSDEMELRIEQLNDSL